MSSEAGAAESVPALDPTVSEEMEFGAMEAGESQPTLEETTAREAEPPQEQAPAPNRRRRQPRQGGGN